MSYLPRMSKTYKEPEEHTEEEPAKEMTFNNIRIASAQLDGKSHNPQIMLKQYNYYPHPPPVLPGPSLIQEAEENEKISTEAKMRRSKEEEKVSNISTSETEVIENFPFHSVGQKPTVNFALVDFEPINDTPEDSELNTSRKVTKLNKTWKKASVKMNKIREESVKVAKCSANDEMPTKKETEAKSPLTFRQQDILVTKQITNSVTCENPVRQLSSHMEIVKSDHKRYEESGVHVMQNNLLSTTVVKGSIHEGIQCYPICSSEKIFVMPICIHFFMKTLSFLIQELDKSEVDCKPVATKEVKKLLNQINETINALSSRKIDETFTLQTSLSDRKRLEKIYSDIERYIQDAYGENGKLGCKSKEKKQLYCKLFQKEYELNVLREKLKESEIQNPNIKQVESTTTSPEVVLQNKSLENEQLRAEVEFSSQELKKFHQTLAEKNWEIHKFKEEISYLRKKIATLKSQSKK